MKKEATKGTSDQDKGTPKKGKSSKQESPNKTGRWATPRVALPIQTKFCFTKEDFHIEYGLCLDGQDPKLLCNDDFSDEEWLSVWLYKRHQKEKMHLKLLRPELYEECLLLYHKVYQGAPPNSEIGVHFAHGFTWQKCKGTEDSDALVAWAVFAEGVITMLRQQKNLNRKLEKWRSTNGPCLINAENMSDYTNYTGTGFDRHTNSGEHQFSGQVKEEFLKKRAFGSMSTFGMSNVSSTTFSASKADVAALSKMKADAAEKLKEKQQCLETLKIALDHSKTNRDEQAGLWKGAAKIIDRLKMDMQELKLLEAGPNMEAVAKLETMIQIRQESLKDMGIDIEVENLDSLGEEVAKLQGQHDTLLWEVEVATGHLRFVETIINMFKSRMPFLPVRPPVHLASDNSWAQFGDCVACGMSIMQLVVTGVYMLQCQHAYHPLCFVTSCKSASQCLFHGCEEPLKDALNLLTPGEANMDDDFYAEAEKGPVEGTFESPLDGFAHSQAGSSRKPDIDSICGGGGDKNASQKQAGEGTHHQEKPEERVEKRADVEEAQGDASKESAEVPVKPKPAVEEAKGDASKQSANVPLKPEPAENKDVEDAPNSFDKPIEVDTAVILSDDDVYISDVCEMLRSKKKRSTSEEPGTPKKKAKVASEPAEADLGGKKTMEPSSARKKSRLQGHNLKPPKPKSRKKLL